MEERLEEAKKIVEDMEKETELNNIESLIKDNTIEFIHEEKKYRVRLLTQGERDELDQMRRKKFGQLIQDKDILLEKDLIKILKEIRGLDLEITREEVKKLGAEEFDLMLKLGEAISKNEGETILKTYEDQITELKNKKRILRVQETLLLEFSLENQLFNYVLMIITYLSLDELKDGKWQRLFTKFEDFKDYKDNKLLEQAGTYSTLLQGI